jgi:hypothetical protein
MGSRLHDEPDLPARLRVAEDARDAERERADAATALFLAVARLHAAQGRADVLAALDEIALTCLGGAQVGLYVLSPTTGRLELRHAGGPRARAAAASHPLGVGLPGVAANSRRLVVEPAADQSCDAAIALGDEGGAVLVLHGIPLEGHELPEELRQRITIVAHHAGIALRRALAPGDGGPGGGPGGPG